MKWYVKEENHRKMKENLKKVMQNVWRFQKSRTFATAIERESNKKLNGALVQLVRIHACHAWGHGFESRTHRSFNMQN